MRKVERTSRLIVVREEEEEDVAVGGGTVGAWLAAEE
jgi:hypothetical protein